MQTNTHLHVLISRYQLDESRKLFCSWVSIFFEKCFRIENTIGRLFYCIINIGSHESLVLNVRMEFI